MDKKDVNGNEHLDTNETPNETPSNVTEDTTASDLISEGTNGPSTEAVEPAAEEPASTVNEPAEVPAEPVKTAPAASKESNIPVMSKVGAPEAAASAPGSKSSKGWMIASIILAAALIIVLIKPPFQKDDDSSAVATVNGADITKGDFYDKLVEAGGESTLQNLITTTLVGQEAKKANITVTDEDINAELEDLKAQFGGEEAFNNALMQSGMSVDDLKAQMPLQVEIRKLLEPKITVTDEEISTYFNDNKASFNQEEQVRASHILVETKEEADAIVTELKGGADFATLAKEKSADTGSKDNGGDLNFFTRAEMVAEFSDAAFNLKVGEVSEPVKSDYGYHIIKVTDRKEAHEYTLEEKKEDIKKTLTSQKVSEMSSTWLADLTSSATITNSLTDKPEESEAPAASDAPAASEAPASEAPATE
ncbi:peptidylprolyl isomerase [Paenibacillus tepidiphilus]|uniref:peptidylprolyl isomerase n=1 Tax=Paenibacillus tepidiphilus TaxID=2608683 RepID=UPI0012399A19|nr:peptidylprolyl isomerase [Paenibacillus tepidiphilus]